MGKIIELAKEAFGPEGRGALRGLFSRPWVLWPCLLPGGVAFALAELTDWWPLYWASVPPLLGGICGLWPEGKEKGVPDVE